ncbi:hypothetical protein O3P69_004133 [Scylla paramamosain]|uniref:Chitin-binding type-2 domain-containing protein n=1 Tax=Scylla paramamosain TaxID=85552 RepID=A0AAW0UIN3_SCYPA
MKVLLLGTLLVAASGARLGSLPYVGQPGEFSAGVPVPAFGHVLTTNLHTSSGHLPLHQPAFSSTQSQALLESDFVSESHFGRNVQFNPHQQSVSNEFQYSQLLPAHHVAVSGGFPPLPYTQQDTQRRQETVSSTAQSQADDSSPLQDDTDHFSQQKKEEGSRISQQEQGDKNRQDASSSLSQHRQDFSSSQQQKDASSLISQQRQDNSSSQSQQRQDFSSSFSQQQHQGPSTPISEQQQQDTSSPLSQQRQDPSSPVSQQQRQDPSSPLSQQRQEASSPLSQQRQDTSSPSSQHQHEGISHSQHPQLQDRRTTFSEAPQQGNNQGSISHHPFVSPALPHTKTSEPSSTSLYHLTQNYGVSSHMDQSFSAQQFGQDQGYQGTGQEMQEGPIAVDVQGVQTERKSQRVEESQQVQISGHIESVRDHTELGVFQTFSVPPSATLADGSFPTSFSCQNYGRGFYADPESQCRMFHVCAPARTAEAATLTQYRFTFRCGEGEWFEQHSLTCTSALSSPTSCLSAAVLFPSSHAASSVLFSDFPSALPPSHDLCYLAQGHVITGVRRSLARRQGDSPRQSLGGEGEKEDTCVAAASRES